jgi:tRNA threonylcarbamoyladenosine biosynthesis protein TsaE
VKTLFQPGQQAGLCRRQVDIGHADLGESQFSAPGLDLRDELSSIDHQTPIVESAQPAQADCLARRELLCASEDDTRALATALARSPALAHATLTLHGDLGAGKTTFVRHLLRALGVSGRIKSPTYAVVEPHRAPPSPAWPRGLAVSHFDFYRFGDPREWEDAGFREVFADAGLKLVEWPEKAQGLMPAPDLSLELVARDDESRQVRLRAYSAAGLSLLEAVPA